MSTERNIDTVRQMYEAFGRGDVRAILALVTDDIDWSTDAAPASARRYFFTTSLRLTQPLPVILKMTTQPLGPLTSQ